MMVELFVDNDPFRVAALHHADTYLPRKTGFMRRFMCDQQPPSVRRSNDLQVLKSCQALRLLNCDPRPGDLHQAHATRYPGSDGMNVRDKGLIAATSHPEQLPQD